jgi:hypothetical protein
MGNGLRELCAAFESHFPSVSMLMLLLLLLLMLMLFNVVGGNGRMFDVVKLCCE